MGFKKFFIGQLLICLTITVNSYDSLVENEVYFKKDIEKSKLNGFGEDRIIAILDTGCNDNSEKIVNTKVHDMKIVSSNFDIKTISNSKIISVINGNKRILK